MHRRCSTEWCTCAKIYGSTRRLHRGGNFLSGFWRMNRGLLGWQWWQEVKECRVSCGKWRGIYGDAQQLSVVRAGTEEAERRKRRGGTETQMHLGLARKGLESTTETTCCPADTREPQAACEQGYVTTESMFSKELPPWPRCPGHFYSGLFYH